MQFACGLLEPHRVERRHSPLAVQHCAAICGLRILVLAPLTSTTERTFSMPGRKQNAIVSSRPPSITITPPAGMRVSTDVGGGGGGDGGGGDGEAGRGGGGGGKGHDIRPPAVHEVPSVPASGLWHSFRPLGSSPMVT